MSPFHHEESSVPSQEEQTDAHQRACTYTFEAYADANRIARELAILGATDVKVTRSAEEFRVKFKANWSIEQQLIKVMPEDAGPFRTTSPSSKEERALMREMYCCWYDKTEFESTFRRSRPTLARILEGEGLLVAYPNKNFDYDWEDLFVAWEDELSPTIGFSEVLVEILQVAGVLESSAKQFIVGEDYSYFPVNALARGEIENLYSLLCEAGEWEKGRKLALALGDPVNAARLLRRESRDQDPSVFFRIVETTEGLPMEMLYQRELARAYWAWKLIKGYSRMVARWADAAKLRVVDYYAKESIGIPHTLRHPDLRKENPIVHALAAIGDEPTLESLANNESNKLAATILADMHRMRMKQSDYPLDAANHWASLQDGYWPTQLEIHDAIANCITYDHQYAKKMEHLGFTYWGLRNKSYTDQW